MKANAPEKIYVVDATFPDYVDFDGSPINTKRIDDHDIEYTRADAFIEKACDAYCKVCGHYPHTTPNHICRQACDYYEDFRNYMNGE